MRSVADPVVVEISWPTVLVVWARRCPGRMVERDGGVGGGLRGVFVAEIEWGCAGEFSEALERIDALARCTDAGETILGGAGGGGAGAAGRVQPALQAGRLRGGELAGPTGRGTPGRRIGAL